MQIMDEVKEVKFSEQKGPYSTFAKKQILPKIIFKQNFLRKNWLSNFYEDDEKLKDLSDLPESIRGMPRRVSIANSRSEIKFRS